MRNLTNSPGVHERSPIWSPDGRSIAYFSDESGEYELHIRDQEGKGEPKKWKPAGAGFYETPVWSPDSKKIAYVDNARALYWIDVATGAAKKVSADHFYGPVKTLRPAWSPDSRWLAYAVNNAALMQRVYVYSVEQDKSFPVTDGLSDAAEPVFDRSGKYLYFFASTTAGPVVQLVLPREHDLTITRSIYLAVLRKDLPSPLVKESDEEKGAAAEKKDDKEKEGEKKKEEAKDKTDVKSDEKPKPTPAVEPVRIDFDGIEQRILDLPVPAAQLRPSDRRHRTGLLPPDGRREDGAPALRPEGPEDRDAARRDVEEFEISADGKKLLVYSKESWAIVSADAKKIDGSEGVLKTAAIEVRVDPRAEWPEMFDDAWRINRDYFYDPNMHGVDWKAMRQKYAQFLPHLSTRAGLEPRPPMDALASSRSATATSSTEAILRRRSGRCPGASSARTTRSRTAATGSRRSTAA